MRKGCSFRVFYGLVLGYLPCLNLFMYMISLGKGRLDEAKMKYLRSTVKLHKLHNDYMLGIKETQLHQEHYLDKNLPTFLDYHQNTQHILVEQWYVGLVPFRLGVGVFSSPVQSLHIALLGKAKISPRKVQS